jgi:hypothetical protein
MDIDLFSQRKRLMKPGVLNVDLEDHPLSDLHIVADRVANVGSKVYRPRDAVYLRLFSANRSDRGGLRPDCDYARIPRLEFFSPVQTREPTAVSTFSHPVPARTSLTSPGIKLLIPMKSATKGFSGLA